MWPHQQPKERYLLKYEIYSPKILTSLPGTTNLHSCLSCAREQRHRKEVTPSIERLWSCWYRCDAESVLSRCTAGYNSLLEGKDDLTCLAISEDISNDNNKMKMFIVKSLQRQEIESIL